MKSKFKILALMILIIVVTAVLFSLAMISFSNDFIFWPLLILCLFSAISIVLILMIAWTNRQDIVKWVKEKIKKLIFVHCPKCGSNKLEYPDGYYNSRGLIRKRKCVACGHIFRG